MLLEMSKGRLSFVWISKQVFEFLIEGAESFMGHEDLADEFNVEYNRKPLTLKAGDTLYIAQVCNKRGTGDEKIKYLQVFVEE
jgi:hypothetical protein